MGDNADLIRQLDKLRKVALRAEYLDAAQFLGRHLADLRKTERERPWPLGRCIWCWVEHRRLREATVYDPGGGPPVCDPCFDDLFPDG